MIRKVIDENKRKESINNVKCFCAKTELLFYIHVVEQSLCYPEKAKIFVVIH